MRTLRSGDAGWAVTLQPDQLGPFILGQPTGPGRLVRENDGAWQGVSFDPTQFREMIRRATVAVDLRSGRPH